MGVGAEIGAAVVLGNEATENRSGRLSKDRRYSLNFYGDIEMLLNVDKHKES